MGVTIEGLEDHEGYAASASFIRSPRATYGSISASAISATATRSASRTASARR